MNKPTGSIDVVWENISGVRTEMKIPTHGKPVIKMLTMPCKKAQEILCDVADLMIDCNIPEDEDGFDYVWTGLRPVHSKVPVFSPCTGVDHIQSPEIIHLDQRWKDTEGKEITSTAEHTLSLMLQLAKLGSIQLYGKNILIVGMGRIGSMVANYSKALGMNVTYTNNYKEIKDLSVFNVISIHVPLSKDTYHLINGTQIFKKYAIIINTSRKDIVYYESLPEFVYYASDFSEGDLYTNHIGGNCIEARELTDIYIAKKFVEYVKNKNV